MFFWVWRSVGSIRPKKTLLASKNTQLIRFFSMFFWDIRWSWRFWTHLKASEVEMLRWLVDRSPFQQVIQIWTDPTSTLQRAVVFGSLLPSNRPLKTTCWRVLVLILALFFCWLSGLSQAEADGSRMCLSLDRNRLDRKESSCRDSHIFEKRVITLISQGIFWGFTGFLQLPACVGQNQQKRLPREHPTAVQPPFFKKTSTHHRRMVAEAWLKANHPWTSLSCRSELRHF